MLVVFVSLTTGSRYERVSVRGRVTPASPNTGQQQLDFNLLSGIAIRVKPRCK